MLELDLIKKQLDVLRHDMDTQGTRMQKDMEALLAGMTQVIQNFDRRLSVIEKAVRVEQGTAESNTTQVSMSRDGVEL